jgi:Lrp/AsnC family leucine-responsive transcriptional regulator
MERIANMDLTDRQLVRLLQGNARLSYQELGEAVGLSGPAAFQRVRKLERTGVLVAYEARVDPAKLGRPAVAFLRVRPEAGTNLQRLVSRWEAADEVQECHVVTGEAGYLLKLRLVMLADLQHHIDAARQAGCLVSAEVVVTTEFERSVVPVR